MQLNFETIKAITCGVVSVTEQPEGILFHRFTDEQTELYRKKREDFYYKTMACSGVKLCFRTNSQNLSVKFFVESVYARHFMCLEVFADGKCVGCIDNYSGRVLPREYADLDFPLGEFSGEFCLGEGVKQVSIYLPWNMKTLLQELSVDDGAFVEPVKPTKTLLALGDSITQGYDALLPSRRYAGRLAEALGVEEINKAIGGERFCPDLAALRDDFDPDYILVAYGTNNWSATTRKEFDTNVVAFFENLEQNYPGVKTFVLTPIWRSNLDMETDFDSFFYIEEGIRQAIGGRENMILIPGFDFVPHSIDFFSDYGLHPNNEGFDNYFENLLKAIKKHI